jgi:hypothetical protein
MPKKIYVCSRYGVLRNKKYKGNKGIKGVRENNNN